MAHRDEADSAWRNYVGIGMFALFALGFCSAVAAVWPVLVARLNAANWTALTLSHLALLLSMTALYVKAWKRRFVTRFEVFLAAGLTLMVSGMDLSLLLKH